jgi:hypothetical protein
MRLKVLALTTLALAACQSAPEAPPPAVAPIAPIVAAGSASLDSSVTIIPPDSKVSSKYAAFSGIWAGSWDGIYSGKLAVRTVAANGRVTVTYAWGEMADNKPGIVDGKGRIGGSTLKLERFANGADATFTMQSDGTLAGTYTLLERTYAGVFHRER